jgi:hypothetical protein
MAILPPDSPRRRDRGKEEAAQKQRARFARDVGDEHGQAWAHQPVRRPRRSKITLVVAAVFVAFAVIGALPLILHKGDSQLVQPNCDTPALEAGPARIKPGTNFAWQAAGPQTGPYVVTIDAAEVTGAAAGPVKADTGRILSGPIGLDGCRSAQTVTAGPESRGSHEVALFRYSGSEWSRVAVALLNVS